MSLISGLFRSINVMTILCVGIFCFGIVTAVMVSSPDVIKPGEQVSVYVGNLNAGVPVAVQIVGNIKTDAGSFFSYGIHDLQLGLAMNNPNLHVNMNGLVPDSHVNLTINHHEGAEIAYPPKPVDANGVCDFSVSEPGLPKGTYTVQINGTAAKTQIPVTFEIDGNNVYAETLAECSFNVVGFSNGIFDVTTRVDGTVVERKQFTVQDQLIAIK